MATDRRIRIEPGVIIKALEAQIAALRAMDSKSPEYGNNLWRALRLEDQIEALGYRPTMEQVAGWGGEWLGIIRNWMQNHARNGSDVTWGSHETLHLTTTLTPYNLEYLAARIAQAAINDHMGAWIKRVERPKEPTVAVSGPPKALSKTVLRNLGRMLSQGGAFLTKDEVNEAREAVEFASKELEGKPDGN